MTQPNHAGTPDPFDDPSGGGSIAPRARHLIGRTVVYIPKSYDPNATFEGQPRPNVITDMIVVDGVN